jgi:hypothetical protein
MPTKMARSATEPPFEVPGLRQSTAPPGGLVRKRQKRKNSRRFGVHLENPGENPSWAESWADDGYRFAQPILRSAPGIDVPRSNALLAKGELPCSGGH